MRIESLSLPEFQIDEISKPLIIEMVRAEISAARSLRRTVLIRRVLTRLQLSENSRVIVNSIINALIKRKDILAIDQGLITITPIRAIELGPTRVAILSSLPTSRLEAILNQPIEGDEQRSIKGRVTAFETVLKDAGGLLLSVGEYAGVNQSTVANKEWLDNIKRRKNDVMSKPKVVEAAENYRWYQQKWLSFSEAPDEPCLWGGEDRNGYSVFIWSSKKDLIDGQGLYLSKLERTLTQYALDRVEGYRHHMNYCKLDDGYKLSIDKYLPINVFKALSCFSYKQDSSEKVTYYSIYEECIEQVIDMLNTQLSIKLVEAV
jgi:hypothetical protein